MKFSLRSFEWIKKQSPRLGKVLIMRQESSAGSVLNTTTIQKHGGGGGNLIHSI